MSKKKIRAVQPKTTSQPKTTIRCDEVVVQIVAREVDEHGRVIAEKVSQPVKIFRGAAPDFWVAIDTAVAAMASPASADEPQE